jgi:hypothetical protein
MNDNTLKLYQAANSPNARRVRVRLTAWEYRGCPRRTAGIDKCRRACDLDEKTCDVTWPNRE